MDREAPHVGAGLEEVSCKPLRNLSFASLGGAEGKLGGESGGRVRLGAHACRRYWFSQEVTKGRRDYVGPGPLGPGPLGRAGGPLPGPLSLGVRGRWGGAHGPGPGPLGPSVYSF